MIARIVTELLLWVLLEFTGYGQLADIGEFLVADVQVTHLNSYAGGTTN
jgi:hypothetical protein